MKNLRNIFFIILAILILLAMALVIVLLVGEVFSSSNEQEAIAAPAPVSVVPVQESIVLDFGTIGAYHAVLDSNRNQWTLGIWEESCIRQGIGLAGFKQKATSVSFIMPYDGEINNSAGHISINNRELILGNPAKDSNGNSLIKKGDSVTIWTDGPNDSAGFQLWFK